MRRLHRWLLRLLPRGRRAEHGEDITSVFEQVLQQARADGRSTVGVWIREARGLVRYGMRERMRPPRMDARLAWRGLRARGWRAAISIVLLGVAIGANTVMFAVADALLFRPVTYQNHDRLVSLTVEQNGFVGVFAPRADEYDAWKTHRDLFSGVEGYLHRTVFLVGQGTPELVPTIDITPGFTQLLGVPPRWGRPLGPADTIDTNLIHSLIGEELARQRFGSPERAIGQRLETTSEPLMVVGVMDASFRFPGGTQRIWRALDPRGPLTRGYGGITLVARLAQDADLDTATALLIQRSPRVQQETKLGRVRLMPLAEMHRTNVDSRTLWLLCGAALSLLLVACANVASLEMAMALTRARAWAIHRALGATRPALARNAAWEGLLLLAPAAGLAAVIAWTGVDAAAAWLPEAMSQRALNPFDIDPRAVIFMAGAAVGTWLLTSLPTILYASRSNAVALLRADGRSSESSAGTRFRQPLTAAQVALAVLLLTCGFLAGRHYLSVLSIDRGFDSHGLLQVSLTLPPQDSPEVRTAEARLRHVLASVPGVSGVTAAVAPPSGGDSPMPMAIRLDDGVEQKMAVTRKWIDEDYFRVVGIRVVAGRPLRSDDGATAIVISERFAQRLGWGRSAAGRQLQLSPMDGWQTIVGVVPHIPAADELLPGPADRAFQAYVLKRPPRPAPPARGRSSGAASAFAALVVRADSPARATDVLDAVRRTEPRFASRVRTVDQSYAQYFATLRLVRQVTIAFGLLGLVVSLAGIYGVISYIVEGRRKEFGIRLALGARRSDIRALVLRISSLMVIGGALAGVVAAWMVSRWIGSQLFGIETFQPGILALMTLVVSAIAMAAVWGPAEGAAGSDPVALLRE